MSLLSCQAGGTTFALLHADVGDPAAVSLALLELRQAAVGNFGGAGTGASAVKVPGMTPNPASVQLNIQGRRSDGVPVEARVAVFTQGLRVYQGTVFTERLESEAAETFLSEMKFQN